MKNQFGQNTNENISALEVYYFKVNTKGESMFCLQEDRLMPSPSAFSKFVLSVFKFLGILKFLGYTQNILGVLKWANLCSKI